MRRFYYGKEMLIEDMSLSQILTSTEGCKHLEMAEMMFVLAQEIKFLKSHCETCHEMLDSYMEVDNE